MTKPLNEHLLWKSKVQKSNYPARKPPMILPKICSLTGIPLKCPNVWDEITDNYNEYSKAYWKAVELRRIKLRQASVSLSMPYIHDSSP